MDVTALIARLRDHYVDQFEAFAEKQRRACAIGSPEVKFQLSEQSGLFRRLYCVDYVTNDDSSPGAIELVPDTLLTFDTMSGTFGGAELSITQFQWDAVVIDHDLNAVPPGALDAWFERWFDPEDKRHGSDVTLSLVVHSMLVEESVLSIDFGTSPADAFWEMLELLEAAGATKIVVRGGREENPTDASGIA